MNTAIGLLLISLSWSVAQAETVPADERKALDALVMADYAGINPGSTKAARMEELKKIDDCRDLAITVQAWPKQVLVDDPQLTDGDRGFAWVMSSDQLAGLVIKRMKERGVLTVKIADLPREENKAVAAWMDAQGFASVVSK